MKFPDRIFLRVGAGILAFAIVAISVLAIAIVAADRRVGDEGFLPGTTVALALAIGSTAAIVAACFGHRSLPEPLGSYLLGTLIGVQAGVLLGRFVYAPFATYLAIGHDQTFFDKWLPSYVGPGMVYGGVLGAVAGLLWSWRSHRTASRTME